MKLSRSAAAAIGVAVVAVSGLAIAAPASAATPGVTFITASQIAPNGTGDVVGWSAMTNGALTSSIDGLTVQGGQELNYGFATPLAADTGSAFVDLAEGTYFTASDGDDIYAEIYWIDASNTLRYLFAAQGGSNQWSDTAVWYSSGSLNGLISGTLEDFDDAFSSDPALAGSKILSTAIYFGGLTVNLYVFGTQGESFTFLPTPVVTGAPATIGQVDYGTAGKGYTVSTTGFVPNEPITIYASSPGAGGPIATAIADANGTVSYSWVGATTAEQLGDYTLAIVGDDSTAFQLFEFAVVAQATLAATGAEVEVPLIAGGVLLLGGVALAVISAKRRRTV